MMASAAIEAIRARGGWLSITDAGKLKVSPAGIIRPEELAALRADREKSLQLIAVGIEQNASKTSFSMSAEASPATAPGQKSAILVPGVDPSPAVRAAAEWLRKQLQKPRRVAEITAKYCGGKREWFSGEWRCRHGKWKRVGGGERWVGGDAGGKGSPRLQELNQARALLRVEAYEGSDGESWWRLFSSEGESVPDPVQDPEDNPGPLEHALLALFQQGEAVTSPPKGTREQREYLRKRAFLSRPVLDSNPDPWEAWRPFTEWLLKHHPHRYYAVREAEDAIRDVEERGETAGEAYEATCEELFYRFEPARKMKQGAELKMWVVDSRGRKIDLLGGAVGNGS